MRFAFACTRSAVTVSLLMLCATGMVRGQAAEPELARLRALVGDWTVVETFESVSGDRRTGSGRLSVRLGPGGNSIVMEYRSLEGPMKGFELLEILSWHPREGVFQMMFVTAFQPGLSHATGRLEGTDIVFDREERVRGSVVRSRSVLSELKNEQFTLTSFEATEGQPLRRTLVLECSKR